MARSRRIKPAYLKAFVVAFVNSAAVLCTALLVAAMSQDNGTDASETSTNTPSVTPGTRVENLYVLQSAVDATRTLPLACNFQDVGPIFSFGPGVPELEKVENTNETRPDALGRVEKVRRTMNALAENHVLKDLVLVGRVDRMPLDPWRERKNETLAMERVEWFRDWALRELQGIEGLETAVGRALIIRAGPLDLPSENDCPDKAGVECDAPERQRHRSVDVFACWVPKTGAEGMRNGAAPRADGSEAS